MSRNFIEAYGGWGERARRPYAWTTPFLVAAGLGVAMLVAGLVSVVAIMISGVELGDADRIEAVPYHPGPFASLVLVQFAVLLAAAMLWLGLYERRGLASIGLRAPGLLSASWRYLFGVLSGFNLVVLLALAVWAFGVMAPDLLPAHARTELAGIDMTIFQEAELWFWLGVFALVFLFQGGVEEVVFRGWLLSAIASRWGVTLGVIGSSVLFMLAHIHILLMSGAEYAAPLLTAIFLIGLFFALWSVHRRSIIGPVAAHGAYNFFLTASALIVARIENPDDALSDVFAGVIRDVTGQSGSAFHWGLAAPAVVFALLCLAVLVRMMLARDREDAA